VKAERRGLSLVARPERVEAALWRRIRRDADAQSRDRLFAQYRGLAEGLARRRCRGIGGDEATRSDLEQAAMQGLIEAIDHYDPGRKVPFAAYARRRIGGAVSDALARMTERGAIVSQKSRRERESRLSITQETAHDAVSPLDQLAEIATQLALSIIVDGQELSADGQLVVCDNAFDSLAWRQLNALLVDAVAQLPDAEREIIHGHYHRNLLFTDIAKQMGVTASRVSQLHKTALGRLAKRVGQSR
jgi:RNA polymerase sigma factor FliA